MIKKLLEKEFFDSKPSICVTKKNLNCFLFGLSVLATVKYIPLTAVKKQRKVMSHFRNFLQGPPPPTLIGLTSKYYTFFSIWSLLNLEKYKSIHFVCFPKKFWVCLFPTMLLSFFKNWVLFFSKIVYIGGKETNLKNIF